ncbi:MAG: TIGR03915 family putative DNA repair protein [Clostridiales bacterium]|jgi:probable DNA metabolism protein|nr:TIGR03915 family putative DNA repair protein [Clostridiales bacterium]
MPFGRNLTAAAVEYMYDGGLPGLYSCIYDCVYADEMPAHIRRAGETAFGLFPQKEVATDERRALRVRNAIHDKISPAALELVETVFYSCLKDKELHILRFLLLGFATGPAVMRMPGDARVHALKQAERHFWREQHLLLGFIRFTDYEGFLAAAITPKNYALPFLARHFCERYRHESFMIYDKTHSMALVYKEYKPEFVRLEKFCFNPPPEKEESYRALWKQFYNAIAIEARVNLKCRMTHMHKRYWENMPEMEDALLPGAPPRGAPSQIQERSPRGITDGALIL